MGRPGGVFDLDWRRLSRRCFLGTVVMVVWLLAPTGVCSCHSFRDTPIADVSGKPSGADKDRVEAGQGFFQTWWSATSVCYDGAPLLGQEAWKTTLLLSFAGATLVSKILDRILNRRHGLG